VEKVLQGVKTEDKRDGIVLTGEECMTDARFARDGVRDVVEKVREGKEKEVNETKQELQSILEMLKKDLDETYRNFAKELQTPRVVSASPPNNADQPPPLLKDATESDKNTDPISSG
jgi:hypothetical protein